MHHSLVSWTTTTLHFSKSNGIYFAQKESIKMQSFEVFECSVKILQIPHVSLEMTFDFLVLWWKFAKFLKLFSKPNVSFSSNFASLFIVMKDNSFVLFQVKHYVLCTKGNNQSATFWDFRVLGSKFTKILSFLKKEISVSTNFASLFSVMRQFLLIL